MRSFLAVAFSLCVALPARAAALPFDGSVVKATRVLSDGTTVGTSYAFEASSWEPAGFDAAAADLAAAPAALRRGSFLAVYANPGSVDFFDDAGWAQVVEHWRLLARTAKRGGLAGLMFDPEPYEKPWMQFRYRSQAGRKAHALDEYRAKARERGRADALLANEPFGLLPAFLDGWLDAAPESLTLIEGAESPGYRADSEADYARVAAEFRARAPLLLAPESRAGAPGPRLLSGRLRQRARLPLSPRHEGLRPGGAPGAQRGLGLRDGGFRLAVDVRRARALVARRRERPALLGNGHARRGGRLARREGRA